MEFVYTKWQTVVLIKHDQNKEQKTYPIYHCPNLGMSVLIEL